MSLKLTLTAMVVGTALACALLGLQAPSAGMFAGRPIEHGVVQQPAPGVLVVPLGVVAAGDWCITWNRSTECRTTATEQVEALLSGSWYAPSTT